MHSVHSQTLPAKEPFQEWMANLPHSRMVYPERFSHKMQYLAWRLYTPFHTYVRDLVLMLGLAAHTGRQDFLIGRIAARHSVKEFVDYLIAKGYGNHFVAWKDDGELVSLRYSDDFEYQYHIRVYDDREVRAHYEYTPEAHPWEHMQEGVWESRREQFTQLMKGWLTQE